MAFEGLTEKLQNAFKKLTGKGKLNEQNIKDALAADALLLGDLVQAQIFVVIELHERPLRVRQQRAVGGQEQRAFHMLFNRLHDCLVASLRRETEALQGLSGVE